MNREYYPEIFQKIWHAQPRVNTVVRQEVDIDVQFKILSTFSLGDFYWYIINLEDFSFEYISPELEKILGKGRAKKGMFEGDVDEGELEIGQAASLIDNILPVSEIMRNLLEEYYKALADLQNTSIYQFENK